MSKPTTLCKLTKGKALGAFSGFVDTFNYLVDFIENLKGDGDTDEDKSITVDRTVEDRPVIRFKGGGGGTFKVIGTDASEAIVGDTSATEFKTLTFATADDANVEVKVEGDGGGNATATIGVYYK